MYIFRTYSLCFAILAVSVLSSDALGRDWLPSDVRTNLVVWYDAADLETIQASGTAVTNWLDKSGNELNVGQSLSKAPDSGTRQLNSLNVLDYTLGDYLEANPFTDVSTNGRFSVYCVAQYESAGNGYAAFWGMTGGDGTATLDSSGGNLAIDVLSVSFTNGPHAGPSVYCVVYDEGSGRFGYVDGTQRAAGGSLTRGDHSSYLRLMSKTGTNKQYVDGVMAELFMVAYDMDQETRQRCEGYLAHKWGLAPNLPIDHPYKSNTPTVPDAGTLIVIR